MESNRLISNEYYSLSELFSTSNRKVIVPDFQRDYCWGDKTHGETKDSDIVSGFLDTLLEEFHNNLISNVLLGKIDVYEHPKDHIYLTDGQQRITTLYLLMGMLFRKAVDDDLKDKLRRCLISNFEDNRDDKELYLQYAIRESTVFFLLDLVKEFFLKKTPIEKYRDGNRVKRKKKTIDKEGNLLSYSIKIQPWFFNEYGLDPSIISMISALEIIDKKLSSLGNISEFTKFILCNVKIQYYEIQNKKHGEERFVIINTTGRSLTVSENVKPILLGNIDKPNFAKYWEERNTYFWKNKRNDEIIADNGVNDFLIWCFQIEGKFNEVEIIKNSKELLKMNKNREFLESIHKHFNSLNKLVYHLKEEKFQNQFKFINDSKHVQSVLDLRDLSKDKLQNVLLPLLSFISKFENESEGAYQFLRRLRRNYFDWKWDDRKQNYVNWCYVLQIVEKSDSPRLCIVYDKPFEKIPKVELPTSIWYNDEEKIKDILKEIHHREILEWEDHSDFMGDISFLFKTSLKKNDDINIPSFDSNSAINFDKIQKIYVNYQCTIDLIKSEESAKMNPHLANTFRLFRLFIGCNKVEHIKKCSWIFEGVLFSTLNRVHLFKIEYMKLLNSNDLFSSCISFIKQRVGEELIFDLDDFKVEKFIKAWLTLKVFYANKEAVLLPFYDGNETGVAAYINRDDNRLVKTEPFSFENSVCGFGVKSGRGGGSCVQTAREHLWCKPNIIDTPFSGIAFENEDRTMEQIEENKNAIESIMKLITH
jgi:hypothetical protein